MAASPAGQNYARMGTPSQRGGTAPNMRSLGTSMTSSAPPGTPLSFPRPGTTSSSSLPRGLNRRPPAMDSGYWEPPGITAPEPMPMIATLAVRRLMPSGESPSTPQLTRKPGRHGTSSSTSSLADAGSRSFGDKSMIQKASPSDGLVGRSVSSPELVKPTRKRVVDKNAKVFADTQIAPKMPSTQAFAEQQQELQSNQFGEQPDWGELAKESILWLDGLPKQERITAMSEMKQWVRSSGLNWDLWWQYCQRARTEALERQGMSPAQAGPTFLGPNSIRPRVVAPSFNPVPTTMKAYNEKLQGRQPGRPNVSRAQMHARKSPVGISGAEAPLESRPSTEQEWQSLALEALSWLSTLSKEERPAAMSQMRQWIIQSGLNWEAWWAYCRKLQENQKQHEQNRRQWMPDPNGPDTPASWLPPVDGQGTPSNQSSPAGGTNEFGDDRRGAVLVDKEEYAAAQKEAQEAEREERKRKKAERAGREEARLAQIAQWEAESQEKLVAEYHDSWKTSIRMYTQEMFGAVE